MHGLVSRLVLVAGVILLPAVATVPNASAQTLAAASSTPSPSPSLSGDELKGEVIYHRLISGQVHCSQLSAAEFDELGDFYMARMMGSARHGVMDEYMTSHMGEAANTQMHVAMAKRLSGCDPTAVYPGSASRYPLVAGMTGMMGVGAMGGGNMMGGSANSQVVYGHGPGAWPWISLALAVALVAVAVAWLVSSRRRAQ